MQCRHRQSSGSHRAAHERCVHVCPCVGVRTHRRGLSLQEHESGPPEALGHVLYAHTSIYVHLCIYAIALCWLSSSHIDRWRVCVCGSWHIQTITAFWKQPSHLITRLSPTFQHTGLGLLLLSPHCSCRAVHGTTSSFSALKKKISLRCSCPFGRIRD